MQRHTLISSLILLTTLVIPIAVMGTRGSPPWDLTGPWQSWLFVLFIITTTQFGMTFNPVSFHEWPWVAFPGTELSLFWFISGAILSLVVYYSYKVKKGIVAAWSIVFSLTVGQIVIPLLIAPMLTNPFAPLAFIISLPVPSILAIIGMRSIYPKSGTTKHSIGSILATLFLPITLIGTEVPWSGLRLDHWLFLVGNLMFHPSSQTRYWEIGLMEHYALQLLWLVLGICLSLTLYLTSECIISKRAAWSAVLLISLIQVILPFLGAPAVLSITAILLYVIPIPLPSFITAVLLTRVRITTHTE
ncbi:MAG: hypothetical protein ACXADC_17150 [Candidatus Thorarchaeota archaeon]|jgi:hypothetical protein